MVPAEERSLLALGASLALTPTGLAMQWGPSPVRTFHVVCPGLGAGPPEQWLCNLGQVL